MNDALFIAGTDTGVGKTHATCALLYALRTEGLRVCGMKPIASGCVETPDGLRNDDALALQAASTPHVPYSWINPVALRAPLSPHLAAAQEGTAIDLAALRPVFERLRARHTMTLVEGVGGWLAPLGENLPAAQIPMQWRLPVVLVVGLRLGCLSHALLTARAILADGCPLLGWIGNRIDPQMEAAEDNLATLRALLPAPCLGVLPHGAASADAVGHLDLDTLHARIEAAAPA